MGVENLVIYPFMKTVIAELCLVRCPIWGQEWCTGCRRADPALSDPVGSSPAPQGHPMGTGGDAHGKSRQNTLQCPRLLEGSASQQWPPQCSQGAAALRYCPLLTAHSWPSQEPQGKKVLPAAEHVGNLASHHLTLLRATQRRKCSLHTAWNSDLVPR